MTYSLLFLSIDWMKIFAVEGKVQSRNCCLCSLILENADWTNMGVKWVKLKSLRRHWTSLWQTTLSTIISVYLSGTLANLKKQQNDLTKQVLFYWMKQCRMKAPSKANLVTGLVWGSWNPCFASKPTYWKTMCCLNIVC